MRILEYDQVDPLKVIHLNQLALNIPLTPEMVARIRQRDPRAFPFFAIYAVEEDSVLGQLGMFRLPMVSAAGTEDVGGLWAFSIHPEYSESGITSLLIEEAHSRMRAAGLRLSTMNTSRNCLAHKRLRQLGYEETYIWATAMARWETAHRPTRLRAEPPGPEGYEFVEYIFSKIAKEYLGFTLRHRPFFPLRQVSLAEIWILREHHRVVGYALARLDHPMLVISNLVLLQEINIVEAVAAVAAKLKSTYIQIRASRPTEITSLREAGYYVTQPTWDGFLIKPLVSEMTIGLAQELFGIGTDKFLISWLEVT